MWFAMAVVRGSTFFPVDMLRYDRCFPRNSQDAARISSHCDPSVRREECDIEVCRYATSRREAENFTVDRWASFGWSCQVLTDYSRRI